MTWAPHENLIRPWKGALEPSLVGWSEEEKTNHALWSNDMSTAWTAILQGGAKIQNAAIAPNGLMEATEFFGDEGGGATGQVRHAEGLTNIVDGQLLRYSVYVKNVQGDDWILLSNSSYTAAIDRGVNYFNIVTGVAGTITDTGVSGIEAASLTYPDAPAGWWRIWGHIRPQGDTVGNIDLYQRTGDSHPNGNRDNNSYYGWGFMVEPAANTNGRPSTLVETGATNPVTVRRRVSGAAPAKKTVVNVCGYSHILENWFAVLNVTVQDNVEVARVQNPRNSIPLALITDDATDGLHYVGQVNQYTADATRRRLSIYVKPGTARYVILTDRIPSIANTQWSNIFDTTDGVWTFQGTLYNTPFPDKYEAEDIGEGVWRLSFVSAVNSGAYDNLYVGISSGPTKEEQSYIGTGDTLYAGGAQIEYDTEESPGPLVRHDGSGTSGGQSDPETFNANVIRLYKGAVEPSDLPRVYGLPVNELILPTGLSNQEMNIRLVGSTILKIDEFNSSQVIVDREFAVKTELYNSNTTIKVAD